MSFADKLRRLMIQAGLTQEQLAAACGVSQAAVAKWMNGALPRRAPGLRLATIFGVSYEELFDPALPAPSAGAPARGLGLRLVAEAADSQGSFEQLNEARMLGLRRQVAEGLDRLLAKMARLSDAFREINAMAAEFRHYRSALAGDDHPQLMVAEGSGEPEQRPELPRRGRVNYPGRTEGQPAQRTKAG